jgi:hypothetical protein
MSLRDEFWNWLKGFRVWEAVRRIFLYPENWLRPESREDKRPSESELDNQGISRSDNPRKGSD